MKYKYKNIIALCIAAVVAFSPTMSVFATDYRDAGYFEGNPDGGVLQSVKNDQLYYPNNEGGYTVYVPYTQNMSGKETFTSMFTGLFDIYKTAYGGHYESAGARYNASGLSSVQGIKTSYFVKKVSLGGISSIVGPVVHADPATTDLKNLEPKHNVEFRYAGVTIDPSTRKGTVVTNPAFPSDMLGSSSGGEKREYEVYDKFGRTVDAVTMYGTSQTVVIPQGWFYQNYPGSSGVPTNKPNDLYNSDEMAKGTFEKWARTTDTGAAYKAAYSTNPEGVEWWKYLKKFIRIDGDYRTQSVLLSTVFYNHWSGGTIMYATYGVPSPVNNNMIASKIQVLDDQKKLLDYVEQQKSRLPMQAVSVSILLLVHQ